MRLQSKNCLCRWIHVFHGRSTNYYFRRCYLLIEVLVEARHFLLLRFPSWLLMSIIRDPRASSYFVIVESNYVWWVSRAQWKSVELHVQCQDFSRFPINFQRAWLQYHQLLTQSVSTHFPELNGACMAEFA